MESKLQFMSQLSELLPFLKHDRPDVREAATEHIAGLAADPSSRALLRASPELVKTLARITGDLPGPKLAALRALVLLTSDAEHSGSAASDAAFFVSEALEARIEERCWNELDGEPATVDLALGVLANVSRVERGAAALLVPPRRGRRSGLADAVRRFLDASAGPEWDNVALLLNNVSMLPAGRRFIDVAWFVEELGRDEGASPARRRGVAGALRNVAQASDTEAAVLCSADLVPAITARLPKEKDPDILVEYLVALKSIAASGPEGLAACLDQQRQLDGFVELMTLPFALREAIVALRGVLRGESDATEVDAEIDELLREDAMMSPDAMD